MRLTPGAKLNDQFFNVLLIRDMHPLIRILRFMSIYNGSHIHTSGFTYLTANSISIKSEINAML